MPYETPAQLLRGSAGSSRAAEGIQHDISDIGAFSDEGLQQCDWLLRDVGESSWVEPANGEHVAQVAGFRNESGFDRQDDELIIRPEVMSHSKPIFVPNEDIFYLETGPRQLGLKFAHGRPS